MGKPFYKRRGNLAGSIQYYGFAAAIEATNNLRELETENKKTGEMITIDVYGAKTEQVLLAKTYLELLAAGQAEIIAGIAYNGDLVDPPSNKGLDFLIDINYYNPDRLEKVANDMRYSRYLGKGKPLLEAMLSKRCSEFPLPVFFASSQVVPCSKYLGMDVEDYWARLSILKGLCMELYIRNVFDKELEDKVIYSRRKFNFKKGGQVVSSEADNIIVCGKEEFYDSLNRIQFNKEFTTWINPISLEFIVC